MIEGFDIAGICGPLVTQAFSLAGTATVQVTVVCGGSFKLNAGSDTMVVTGGKPITFAALKYRDLNREEPDVVARTSTLIIDPAALAAAAAAQGVAIPPLNNNDAIAIADNTGTKTWTIFEQNAIPAGVLLSYQIRR
jgi:hypothetical protein